MDPHFLRLESVTKTYDQHRAVDDVSLAIPKGKIYGLLGPNGAGKTSIIRMITGITAPDKGQIWFDGELLTSSHTRKVGYMPEERGLYKKMPVLEQITYLLSLRGMEEKKAKKVGMEWLEKLELGAWAKRKAMDLSKGMQQKVQFIATVAHQPPLLILDEPFSGLDPVNTQTMEREILRMRDEGTTIIFSTHRMEQVEELCEYIALMSKGKKVLEDDIHTVRKQFQKNRYELEFAGDRTELAQLEGVTIEEMVGQKAQLTLQEGQTTNDLLRRLADSPVEILRFALHLPKLNDIFIEIVQRS